MIFSKSHKFIYFCNSKTGTSSIERALGHYDEGGKYRFSAENFFSHKHIPPSMVKPLLPAALWEECFKFVFVRNPYDWFVSQWFYNFGNYHTGALKKLGLPLRMMRNRRLLKEYKSTTKHSWVLENRQVFSNEDVFFLYDYLRARYRALPYHEGKLQLSYVFGAEGEQLVDFVGRFENLEHDFAEILNRIGLQAQLPRINASRHKAYPLYFDEQSANMVYKLWQPDFDAFGYSKDIAAP